jgi:hypothetical protein
MKVKLQANWFTAHGRIRKGVDGAPVKVTDDLFLVLPKSAKVVEAPSLDAVRQLLIERFEKIEEPLQSLEAYLSEKLSEFQKRHKVKLVNPKKEVSEEAVEDEKPEPVKPSNQPLRDLDEVRAEGDAVDAARAKADNFAKALAAEQASRDTKPEKQSRTKK